MTFHLIAVNREDSGTEAQISQFVQASRMSTALISAIKTKQNSMQNIHCIIDKIILNQEKASIIFEDNYSIAFLDHRPLFYGHTLVAPKKHIENIHELPSALIEPFFSTIKKIAKAVEIAMKANGSFIAMNNTVSQSIPHLHVHIVPRNTGDGLKGFFWPRMKYDNLEQMTHIKEKIKKALLDSLD